MVRTRALATAALLVIGLAACGSNTSNVTLPSPSASSSPPGTGSPSPLPPAGSGTDCASLASAADVSAIVGETVTGPTSSSANAIPGLQATGCDYVAPDGTVAFSFGHGPNDQTVQVVFQQSKQAQGGQDVSGVGDSAYFSPGDHNLLVIQGTTFVSVGVLLSSLSDPTKEQEADVALAQKVLAGL
jgi:hypothetical protein